MQGFKSILVVLSEGSEAELAWARAVRLARETGAALTLVDVIEAASPGIGSDTGIAESVIAAHRDRLSGFAERTRAHGVETTEAVLQGSVSVDVIKMVLREGHDILITGAALRPAEGHGVVDRHLLRKCPCPVWVVAGPSGDRVQRVLAAVTLAGPGAMVSEGLERRILDLAVALAADDGAELHVMYDAPDDVAGAEAVRVACPQVAMDRIVPCAGRPDDSIATYLTAQRMDLLVTGLAGPRDAGSATMAGPATEASLGRGGCSVLAVKPEGFVSPVTLEAAG